MAASVLAVLPLCLAVQVFDPLVIRPPEPGISPERLATYPDFVRGLFRGLAGVGLFALMCLFLALRALRRGNVVAHVGWILTAGAVGHTAFFVSGIPKLFPGIYERDPTLNPVPWLLPPLAGALLVVWACRRVARLETRRLDTPGPEPHRPSAGVAQ
jgi:hypothetical protein